MKTRRLIIAFLIIISQLISNVSPAYAFPPLPSPFWGLVTLDGVDVPLGTIVSARINGVQYATATVTGYYLGVTAYFALKVPGDDTATPGIIEGGIPGDTVVFYIGSYLADQSAPWVSGPNVRLDLTGTSFRTVIFDANGGTGTMSDQVANVPTALTLNSFTRAGYSFSGWNTNAGGTGTAYADGAIYDFSADITLYALWSALPMHTVTFNSNGGTGTMSAQTTNVPTALTTNAFTRLGYSFSGWNTAANGSGTAYADGASYAFSADATLYAQWSALPMRTVIFDNNGGTGTMVNQVANVPTALTLNSFTRLGYSFSGWNTAANGSGTAYADGASYAFSADAKIGRASCRERVSEYV